MPKMHTRVRVRCLVAASPFFETKAKWLWRIWTVVLVQLLIHRPLQARSPPWAVWTGLHQPTLACFSASDYTSTPETLCYAQPKTHTVHIFCMSVSCSLFGLCDLYRSVCPFLYWGSLSGLWSDHLIPAQRSPGGLVLSLSGCNLPVPILCMT